MNVTAVYICMCRCVFNLPRKYIPMYYISVVMSNIGTNMYGGNIGSLVCVYMHTDTQPYYISVVMSNIGTNMYGGNIGSLMLCVYTCTQTHSCTIYQ